MMTRTQLFISHITENADVAKALKDFIEEKSLEGVEVFVSSDGDIQPGAHWQETIVNKIRSSDVVLVVCTNTSIFRPWVNFEAGGAMVKGATVIPVCWHGCTRESLPPPLGQLQALDLGDEKHIRQMMSTIGAKAGLNLNNVLPKSLLRKLPPRQKEFVDVSPRMILGIGSEVDRRSRLAKDYRLARRRITINLASEYRIQIKGRGPATFTFSQQVIFLEQPQSQELRETLACKANSDFDSLKYKCEDATVTRWERLSPTVVAVHIAPKNPIRALKPFDHSFSWIPPLDWGDDFDSISYPVEVPTNEHRIIVESKIPIEHVVAFKDSDPLPDDRHQLATKALSIKQYGCPPPVLQSNDRVEWKIELPEPQAVYRLVLFYKGARRKFAKEHPRP